MEAPNPVPYDLAYWQNYVALDATERGHHLTRVRAEMVRRWCGPGEIVDIGIGGGAFVREMQCLGHDVNEHALQWLDIEKRRWWQDRDVDTLTFWDSLEHIYDHQPLLKQCKTYVFVSTPIYRDAEHCVTSKHFKPNEHIWYFTDRGLVRYFADNGFELQERNRDEERFGREGIGSYCFARMLPVR